MVALLKRVGTAGLLLFFLGSSLLCSAEDAARWKRRWVLAGTALIGAESLDVVSSRGQRELNPLFRDPQGRFSISKGIGIKVGAVAGMLLVQSMAIRKSHSDQLYRPFTFTAAAAAAALGAVVVHNFAIRSRPAYLTAH